MKEKLADYTVEDFVNMYNDTKIQPAVGSVYTDERCCPLGNMYMFKHGYTKDNLPSNKEIDNNVNRNSKIWDWLFDNFGHDNVWQFISGFDSPNKNAIYRKENKLIDLGISVRERIFGPQQ